MSIQHSAISDPNIHEPKGVSTAATNTSYFSDGAGSGVWKKTGSESFKGLSGDAGAAEMKFLSDGTNGFLLRRDKAYGTMAISNNNNPFALAAAVDPNLATNTDYVLFTGLGAPWAGETLFGITFTTDRLTATVNGVYNVRAWSNVSSFPGVNAKVGAKFKISNTTFSPRTAIVRSTAAGDYGNMSAFGFVQMNAGDYIQLYLASDTAGNVIVRDFNLTAELIRAL